MKPWIGQAMGSATVVQQCIQYCPADHPCRPKTTQLLTGGATLAWVNKLSNEVQGLVESEQSLKGDTGVYKYAIKMAIQVFRMNQQLRKEEGFT
jgi:hypothetical protein